MSPVVQSTEYFRYSVPKVPKGTEYRDSKYSSRTKQGPGSRYLRSTIHTLHYSPLLSTVSTTTDTLYLIKRHTHHIYIYIIITQHVRETSSLLKTNKQTHQHTHTHTLQPWRHAEIRKLTSLRRTWKKLLTGSLHSWPIWKS